jgi:predicted phosphodiesterase
VYQEYVWDYEGIRHVAVHGHQFDRFAINNVVLSRLGEFVFLKLQKVDRKMFFVRYLDRMNSRWLRLSSKVSRGALHHARQVKAGRIFCGHTHFPMQAEKDGVSYYNAGCWVDARSTWISINEEGVKINEYDSNRNQPPADHSHTGQEREETDSLVAEFAGPAGLSADAEYQSTYC